MTGSDRKPPKGRSVKLYRLTEKGRRVGELADEFLEEATAVMDDIEDRDKTGPNE